MDEPQRRTSTYNNNVNTKAFPDQSGKQLGASKTKKAYLHSSLYKLYKFEEWNKIGYMGCNFNVSYYMGSTSCHEEHTLSSWSSR